MEAPASEVASTVVRPTATPITNRLVGEAGCTRATAGLADMMVEAADGRRSRMPVPAGSVTVWLRLTPGAAAGGAVGAGAVWGGAVWAGAAGASGVGAPCASADPAHRANA